MVVLFRLLFEGYSHINGRKKHNLSFHYWTSGVLEFFDCVWYPFFHQSPLISLHISSFIELKFKYVFRVPFDKSKCLWSTDSIHIERRRERDLFFDQHGVRFPITLKLIFRRRRQAMTYLQSNLLKGGWLAGWSTYKC